jgi:hypothetical protein
LGDPALKQLVADLCEAITRKRIEPICAAYQHLRDAAGDGDHDKLLARIDASLGKPARPYIVSAFSHRGCFMCKNGIVPCDRCDATGELLDGRKCPKCRGLGQAACGFCRGTGWADREVVPPELIADVFERHLAHVHEELASLTGTIGPGKIDELRRLPDDQKRTVGAWLIRIYARLRDLVQNGAIEDPCERERLAALADRIRKCLKLMT